MATKKKNEIEMYNDLLTLADSESIKMLAKVVHPTSVEIDLIVALYKKYICATCPYPTCSSCNNSLARYWKELIDLLK